MAVTKAQYIVKLVLGQSLYLGDKRFVAGREYPVSKKEADTLLAYRIKDGFNEDKPVFALVTDEPEADGSDIDPTAVNDNEDPNSTDKDKVQV